MKKLLIFLITIISIFVPQQVKALTPRFYEAEYAGKIYMNRVKNGITYYQRARFFRESGTDKAVYCIEPFATFNENGNYQETISPNNLNESQIERVKLLSYYGYGYKNHTDIKWYAITQFMIWQATDTSGRYFFSNKLNGTPINIFEEEMNEINNLIKNHYNKPNFKDITYTVIYGKNLILEDNTNNLINYKVSSNNAKINGNKLIVDKLDLGTHKILLTKENTHHNAPQIFYQSKNSQNLITIGDLEDIEVEVNVEVQETYMILHKIDTDNYSTKTQGEGKLDGAKVRITSNNGFDQVLTFKNNLIELHNIDYGHYEVKEIEAGIGYTINDSRYGFEITKYNNFVDFNVTNEVIKKEITINKLYGDENNYIPEENIKFEIYDYKNDLVKTLITDKNGIAKTILPYGKYKLVQINTTNGYRKSKDIIINVYNKQNENIIIKNPLIKKELEIRKLYGDGENFKPEENISFNIYKENKLITTITTNKDGIAKVLLPYGAYTIKQVNTTEGYLKVKNFNIEINEKDIKPILLKNNIIKKDITIKKLYGDGENFKPEENIKFEIYKDNKLIKTIITNNEGIAKVLLPYGTYTVKQINSTEGYLKVNDFVIKVENTKDDTIVLKNCLIKKDITIKKLYGDGENFKPEENIKFEIYKDNKLIKTVTTNKDGIIKINLSYGTYKLIQINTSEGYLKVKDSIIKIEDTKEETITLKNNIIKKDIKIKKLYGDGENFKPEENISFNIYKDDKLIKTITTDKDGIATITLSYGKYTIKQLTTTEGYIKVKPIDIEIKDTRSEVITLKNYKIKVPDTLISYNNLSFINKIKYLLKRLCLILNLI